MKYIIAFLFCIFSAQAFSQQLQLLYDARHAINPKYNSKNFTTLYFEYFKTQDSGKAFFKLNSFLLTAQADFNGDKNNMGNFYMQVSQSFRCWQPKIYLNVQYSGGLGVTAQKQYSYYINNAYYMGLSYPFKWKNAYFSSIINYKLSTYNKPSSDFSYTLYWWKGLSNYKTEFSGDFTIWTDNKNHGDDFTKTKSGKGFYFFAQPQYWYKITKQFSVGTKMHIYYHVYTTENKLQVYPTIALRLKL